MSVAEEEGDNNAPRLKLAANAADMLSSGERLVLPVDSTKISPSRVLDIVTTSNIAIQGSNPVKYMNPAAKFDYHYDQFTQYFNQAVAQWDAIETDEREHMLGNQDGKFYTTLDRAYDDARGMLAILSERRFCNQKNTEHYRDKLTRFISQLEVVLAKDPVTDQSRHRS